ncbi:MAG TPA: hypothetical protein VK970_16285 [Candidatus Methylacidiphilales bacterium]|nr:hypothetical protein [Candidatus Methylacidiphilales bacterium]
MNTSSPDFLASGQLQMGANYWASHAGVYMWRDWRADVVDNDFERLATAGLQLLRVFPLWPDFQPIHCLRRDNTIPVEFRHGDTLLSADSLGRSGVSPVMLERFGMLCDLARKHGLGLVVGLVTGWMSGRSFVPPGLEGLNPITSPVSMMWQNRFVRVLAGQFKDHSAIQAWDLGNECNCLGPSTREEAWVWTSALAGTIRSVDSSRPIVSGMHSLSVDPSRPWSIADQSELTDVLTTHPYPLFTPHCNREPMNTIRPLLHATAETRLYADLSGKPAIVEEMGNFGAAFCGEDVACKIIHANLMSLWAHDARAMLWWCAHDQTALEFAPYDWISMERELGLLRNDGTARPVLREIQKVSEALRRLPLPATGLPPRRVDAVCILSSHQDQWGAAYSSFILAKQAGFDIVFHHGNAPLPDAALYLLPSIKGLSPLTRQQEQQLKEKIEAGATAYISIDDGFLIEVMRMTGLEVVLRHARAGKCSFTSPGMGSFELAAGTQFQFRQGSATTLAAEDDGTPVFTVATCGKGKVYFLSVPLETALAEQNGAFYPGKCQSFWKIYGEIGKSVSHRRTVQKTSPWLGITEHWMEDGNLVAVLVNYLPEELTDALTIIRPLASPSAVDTWMGTPPRHKEINETCGIWEITLPPNGSAVLRVQF